MDYLKARFNWTELNAMVRVFFWDILIKRLILVCLPLEGMVYLLRQEGPLAPVFQTYAPSHLFGQVFLLKDLACPLIFMAAIQWLVYIVFMFFLIRQLINIYLADIILRSSMQKRVVKQENNHISNHSCLTCYPRKIIWRLQDQGALMIHMILGSILFQTLPYYLDLCPLELWWVLQSYWRGYLYYQYIFTRDGCCPEGMVYAYRYVPIWWTALQIGAFDTTMDLLCDFFLPSKTIYWFVMVLLDFLIVLWVQVLQVHYPEGVQSHEIFSLNPVWMVWRMAQALVVGGMGIAKRNPGAKSPIHTIQSIYAKAKWLWSGWFAHLLRRFLLWPEYRSYTAMVTKGPTSPYLRSQVMVIFEIASTVRDFMKDYDKRLVLLTGITSTPIVGSWVRMVLDPRIKNVATLLKKIGPKTVLLDTLDGILADVQGPLASTDGGTDPGKPVDQETVLYEKVEMVGGYFEEERLRVVKQEVVQRSAECQTIDECQPIKDCQSTTKSTDECQTTEPIDDEDWKDLITSGEPILFRSKNGQSIQSAILEAIHTPLTENTQ